MTIGLGGELAKIFNKEFMLDQRSLSDQKLSKLKTTVLEFKHGKNEITTIRKSVDDTLAPLYNMETECVSPSRRYPVGHFNVISDQARNLLSIISVIIAMAVRRDCFENRSPFRQNSVCALPGINIKISFKPDSPMFLNVELYKPISQSNRKTFYFNVYGLKTVLHCTKCLVTGQS